MTVRNVEFLFRPQSVAVVAEPDEASRYAEVVLANLPGGALAGPLMSSARTGARCFPSVATFGSAKSRRHPTWRSFVPRSTWCRASSGNSVRAARAA
ncbi:hypothetical protein [Accumulibacter sp.]|uniref:hypothetical protein n=1 Tax=Accumulibacter sp. TaxID=2053492 RepID=UPI00344332D1